MKRRKTTSLALAAAAAALSIPFAAASGQTGTPPAPGSGGSRPAAPSPSTPPTPSVAPGQRAPSGITPPTADLVGYRLPLLREGSVISRVVGDLTLDPDEQHWIFRPIQPESVGLRREFVLLPSPTLEDMLRTRNLSPSPLEYELTGRVYIYKGRNYLFAELAPPIVRFDTRPSQTPAPGVKPQTAPNGESKFVPPAPTPSRRDPSIGKDDDATVEAIERRLEERVGRTPIGRVADSPADNESEGRISDRKSAEFAAGSRLVLRSGRLMRDPTAGSWRFVPEQVSGRGDAALEILPCLLLERLELITRESDSPPTVLLSGQVVVYNDQAYLMPTSFRRSREGRGLGR